MYTSSILNESLDLARKLKGRTHLIAGGYHATALPESLVKDFDSIIMGEGENTILEAIKKKQRSS